MSRTKQTCRTAISMLSIVPSTTLCEIAAISSMQRRVTVDFVLTGLSKHRLLNRRLSAQRLYTCIICCCLSADFSLHASHSLITISTRCSSISIGTRSSRYGNCAAAIQIVVSPRFSRTRMLASCGTTHATIVYLIHAWNTGAEAKRLYAEAQSMLKRIIDQKLIKATGIIGLYPGKRITTLIYVVARSLTSACK